jgi:putative ABC transport system permease protein
MVGDGLVAGFAILAAILLAGALALPPLLSVILRRGENAARRPLAQWFWADSRMQLSGLSVALMALLLALAANIGVGTMVDGFRKTFTDWLDQRLIAEVYLNPGDAARSDAMLSFLEQQPEVLTLLPTLRADARVEGWPVTVVGFVDDPSYRDHWPMKAQTPDIWDAMVGGDALVVSEQLAVRLSLSLDTRLDLGDWQPRVVGIYPDYGNPKGQISADFETVRARFADARAAGIGVRVAEDDIAPMIETLRSRFDLTESQIIDQASLKAFSKGIFEKTFAVTAALNVLTMIVAGIAMLMSLLTLSEMRLPQLAPLWAGGLTRRKLAGLEMGKTLALALFTALLAIPLGLGVAWCLVAVVNVQAFGWRLPLHLFPLQWLVLVGLALVTALLASLIPMLRLRSIAPMRLLRVFADER